MADNYLEKHREEYETRKAAYLKKKRSHLPKSKISSSDK
ncbi:dehydrogenase [Prevotella sp. MGM1]|nr:dehydrogenase [Prevotella sp. MGM1]